VNTLIIQILIPAIALFQSLPFYEQPVYKVTYKHWFQSDTTKPISSAYIRDATLTGNNEKSIYIYNVGTNKLKDTVKANYRNFQEFLNATANEKSPGIKQITISSGIPFDEYGNQILFEKKHDSIFSRVKIVSQYVLVAEKKLPANWEISDEVKKIQGYTCYKATCHHRGRHYTAWFTPEIPIPEGPYKFKGLPGLILEIEDNRGELKIWAEKIQYPAEVEIPPFMASGKPVTFQTYLNLLGKENDAIIDAALAAEQNQPGYNMVDTKPFQKKKNSFCQIELTE
jgi:GLPGLI family protein